MSPSTPVDLLSVPYLGVHTLSRMEPRQLAGIGERKARGLLLPRLPVDFDRLYERRVPDDPAATPGPVAGNTETLRGSLARGTCTRFRERARGAAGGTPTFMNRTLRVDGEGGIDWDDDRFDDLPLLWPLKLYAFEPLSWGVLGFAPGETESGEILSSFDGWVEDWVDSVALGRPGYLRRAFTPWAVSLRVLRWSRYLAWRERTGTGEGSYGWLLRRELYKNALFLHNHVEWDVGGNHLVENGAALAVAGVLFSEPGWVDAGTSILERTADRQFLDDGCHFERSPMYHVLVTTRYLTVSDVLERGGFRVPDAISRTARDATAFLRYLRPPDGRIPLLNDAVYGEALPLDDCLRYASALGVDGPPASRQRALPPDAPDRTSGYGWLRTARGALLFDGGPVGPPHLPGHSHSDTLSVLLWLDGQPVVTDTGTYGYVSGPRREYARGVRGHSTVQVDDVEPIALGGTYLMGPRPEPHSRRVDGPVSMLEGRYRAAPFGSDGYVHHRAVYSADEWWLVWDRVSGHGGSPVRSRLHLDPSVEPTLAPDGRVRLSLKHGTEAVFRPADGARVSLRSGPYYPEFGLSVDRSVVELHATETDREPTAVGVVVGRRPVEEATVETGVENATPTRLTAAGETFELPRAELPVE